MNKCPICDKNTLGKYCSRSCANKGYWLFMSNEERLRKTSKLSNDAKNQWENKTPEERNKQLNKQIKSFKQTMTNKTDNEKQEIKQKISYGVKNYYKNETEIQKKNRIKNLKKSILNRSKEEIIQLNKKRSIAAKKSRQNMSKETKQKISKYMTNRNLEWWSNLTKEEHNTVISNMTKACKNRKYTKNKISKAEKLFAQLLNENNIDFVFNSFIDDRYPFLVDFYIPSKDIFIELDIHWTHGGKLFEGTKADLQKLSIWKEKAKSSKFYENAIQTWTIRDIEKLNYAKNNNICLVNIFKEKDFDNIIQLILEMEET